MAPDQGNPRGPPGLVTVLIDPAARLVRLAFQGETTIGMLGQAIAGVLADPRYQPGFGILVDRREAGPAAAPVTAFAAAELARERRRLAGTRLALVVADTASFGAARQMQTRLSDIPLPCEIFCHPDEALVWLGESDPQRRPIVDDRGRIP